MATSYPTAVIFNIQRYSVHDGPGIRTTVFLKGCPLTCWWCQNPESRDPRPLVSLLPERCLGCEACREACPRGLADRLDEPPRRPEPETIVCARCGSCAEACPSGARSLVGRRYTVENLMLELDKDHLFYDESGGGVTFSGGEPVAPYHAEFLLRSLRACGERSYHRAVDTSGFVATDVLMAVAAETDLFLYDLKLMDDELHQRYVGVSNRPILENLRALGRAGSRVWIRIPLIPGINDSPQNISATADFVASVDRTYPVHILPYHRIGADKYRRLGIAYPLSELRAPTKEQTEHAADRIRAFGLEVRIGG